MSHYKVGIYKIINLVNGKIYIGSSINITNRWKSHLKRITSNSHTNNYLQNAFNKYGSESFLFERIENVKDKSKLLEREQYYMDLLKPFYDTGNGYNICKVAGSNLGMKYSEESKKKMSEWIRTPEMKKNMSEARKGYKMTDSAKEKLRIINTGRLASEETKNKMSDSHKGKILSDEVKDKMSKPKSKEHSINISKGRKGIEFSNEHKKNIKTSLSKKVLMFDLEDNLLEEFPSVNSAAKHIGKYPYNIIDICKERKESVNGYKFKYK